MLYLQGMVERPDAIGKDPTAAEDASVSQPLDAPTLPAGATAEPAQPARKKQRTGEAMHWKKSLELSQSTSNAQTTVLQYLIV